MQYSIVTTCKGRLNHLKQSLPQFLKQKHTEVILVDYNCPEKCGEWAQKRFPTTRIVFERTGSHYNYPRARNLGGFTAFGKWIIFLDCDMIIEEGFLKDLSSHLENKSFLTIKPTTLSKKEQNKYHKFKKLTNFLVCRKEHFVQSGGFDQYIQDFCYFMYDFRFNLILNRDLKEICYLSPKIKHIRHRGSLSHQFLRGQNKIKTLQVGKNKLIRKWGIKVINYFSNSNYLQNITFKKGK